MNYNDELYHWLGLGKQADNHKYLYRVNEGTTSKPKYRYFYTKTSYDLYMRVKGMLNKTSNTLNKNVSSISDFVNSFVAKPLSEITKVSNTVKEKANSIINKNLEKTISNKSITDTYREAKSDYESKKYEYDYYRHAQEKLEKKYRTALTKQNTELRKESEKKDKALKVVSKIPLLSKPLSSLINAKTELAQKFIKNRYAKDISYARSADKQFGELAKEFLEIKTDYLVINEQHNKYVNKIYKQIERGNPKSFDRLRKKGRDRINMTADEDQDSVNPYYDEGETMHNDDWTTNCSFCSAAYELRRRGYDVEAAPHTDFNGNEINTTNTEVYSWYKLNQPSLIDKTKAKKALISYNEDPASYYRLMMPDAYSINIGTGMKNSVSDDEAVRLLEQKLLKEGNGARGQFLVEWAFFNSGHSCVWEIQNNKVIIRDCQTNDVLPLDNYVSQSRNVTVFRTDNCELNDSILNTCINKIEDSRADRNQTYHNSIERS